MDRCGLALRTRGAPPLAPTALFTQWGLLGLLVPLLARPAGAGLLLVT